MTHRGMHEIVPGDTQLRSLVGFDVRDGALDPGFSRTRGKILRTT